MRTVTFAVAVVLGGWTLGASTAEARGPNHCPSRGAEIGTGNNGGFKYKNTCQEPIACTMTLEVGCSSGWVGDMEASCRAGAGKTMRCMVRNACPDGVLNVTHKRAQCRWDQGAAKPKKAKKSRTWVRDDKGFNARIRDGYRFHRVRVFNHADNPCKVTAEIFYTAPHSRWIRLWAKVKFKSGTWIRTHRVDSSAAGERMFSYSFDSTHDGCWGKRPQAPDYLWVTSCLASGCTPETPGG